MEGSDMGEQILTDSFSIGAQFSNGMRPFWR
jgi:hypothetical protein